MTLQGEFSCCALCSVRLVCVQIYFVLLFKVTVSSILKH